MNMIEVTIGGVDGETNAHIVTPRARVALEFLAAYDHEGSVVTIRVTLEDEKGYALLQQLLPLEQMDR